MASKRIAASLLSRRFVSAAPSRCLHIQSATTAPLRHRVVSSIGLKAQQRFESSNAGKTKLYSFEDIQKIISSPSASRILIDTREPSELQSTGRIPGSINIPVGSAPDAWFLEEDAFEDRFGVKKPEKDAEVVMYCKAGVRSRAAAEFAKQSGYKNVAEYPGSWMDWEKKGGEIEKS